SSSHRADPHGAELRAGQAAHAGDLPAGSEALRGGTPMSDATAERPLNLAEHAYQRIKAQLFDLRLLPGEDFTEGQVVEALGVSRTPVRQALQRLAREGFVQVHRRSGWRVRPFDFDRYEHLYDLRVVLELAAVSRLCALPKPEASPVL